MESSSSTAGFFQPSPVISAQYASSSISLQNTPVGNTDPALPRIISLYLPSPLPDTISHDLSAWAATVTHPQTLRLTVDAETNTPTLVPLTAFGVINQSDPLRTGEGWRLLQDLGISEGIVGHAYNTLPGFPQAYNQRVHQFAKIHLWAGTCALVTCPSAMTDGAAKLLGGHLDDKVSGHIFREARRRLVSLDPAEAWTSGQWMTERKGGSDVSGTETVAVRLTEGDIVGEDANGMLLGQWRIDGFKWFSSATDANMAVLLAQTQKGLSAFYAPMRKRSADGESVLNGVRIQRLKNKLGTKGVPTAELELSNMRGYLIGEEGNGVKEISSILNITRLHTAVGNIGYWGRGLAISRAFAKVRRVERGKKLLMDNKQHVRWMAEETVKYHAAMQLVFFGVALIGITESSLPPAQSLLAHIPPEDMELLLRVVTPLMKAQVTLASVEGLRACMESLGGLGYLENNENPELNIARLFRDANVGPIWEGCTSIMADDVLRVLKGKNGDMAMQALNQWIRVVLAMSNQAGVFSGETRALDNRWHSFRKLVKEKEVDELLYQGRDVLLGLEAVVCGALLIADALRDRNKMHIEIAKRWFRARIPFDGPSSNWREDARMDRKIFIGDGNVDAEVKL